MTPGRSSKPASGWMPNLKGSNLPAAAQNGIQQGFTLLYSLRDNVNQLTSAVGKAVQFDTHRNRIQTQAQAMPDSALWFESDRQTAFYMARLDPGSTTNAWFYMGGIYYDTLNNRPTDLGQRDTGFLFLASDNNQLYRWDGKAWVTA